MGFDADSSRPKHRRTLSDHEDEEIDVENSSKRHKRRHLHHRHRGKKHEDEIEREEEDISPPASAPPPPPKAAVANNNRAEDDDVEEGEILEEEGGGGVGDDEALKWPEGKAGSRNLGVSDGKIDKGLANNSVYVDNFDNKFEDQDEFVSWVDSDCDANGNSGYMYCKEGETRDRESKGSHKRNRDHNDKKTKGDEKALTDRRKLSSFEVVGAKIGTVACSSSHDNYYDEVQTRSRSVSKDRERSRSCSIVADDAPLNRRGHFESMWTDFDNDMSRLNRDSRHGSRDLVRDVDREHSTSYNYNLTGEDKHERWDGERRSRDREVDRERRREKERERAKDRDMAREQRREKERERSRDRDMGREQRREKELERSRDRDTEREQRREERERSRDRDLVRDQRRMKERERSWDGDVDRTSRRDMERGESRGRRMDRDQRKEKDRDRSRDRWIDAERRKKEQEQSRDREELGSRRTESDKSKDKERNKPGERDRDREREREKDRYRERERGRDHIRDRERERESQCDRSRDRDRDIKLDLSKPHGSNNNHLEGSEDILKRDEDEQDDFEERIAKKLAEQEEEDIDRIKEESRKRRQAILEKYQNQQQNNPHSEDAKEDKEPSEGIGLSWPALSVAPQSFDNKIEDGDTYDADSSFSVKKSPPQNGIHISERISGTIGLGEGTPKSERSDEKYCDDIFGETPVRVSRTGRGDGLPVLNSGIDDNWDDADGYYSYRFGEILDGRYEISAAHGKGVFSAVVRAKDLKAGDGEPEEVAIKIIRNNETMNKAGKNEVEILQKLAAQDPENKRHCVRFLSSFKYRNHLCLVFESLHMNLREVLKKFGRNIGLRLTAVRAYAKQLFIALKLLKTCGILHCDIKPDNMLVNEAKNVLKLCDFGNAMPSGKNEVTPYLVSRFYRAPEIILGLHYDHPMDVWSVGCCLYELYTGKVLFPGATNNDMLRLHMELKGPFPKKMLKKGAFVDQHFDSDLNFHATEEDPVTKKTIKRLILNIKPRDIGSFITSYPGEDPKLLANFKDLMEKIFVLDPDRRMTVSQALAHPFITGK